MAAEIFASAVAAPVGVGLLASFAIESMGTPRPAPLWQRPSAALLIHMGLWLGAFTLVLAVLGRPWFASAVVSAFLLLVVLVHQAKHHSLREAFLFQDFEYFTDAIKHPRLYLPFLGWGKALLAATGFLVAVYVGFRLEGSLRDWLPWQGFAHGLTLMAAPSVALLWLGARRECLPTLEPAVDFRRLGLLGSLWSYGRAERHFPDLVPPRALVGGCRGARRLPHLVVVQSESFFDPRETYPGVRADVLAGFDALRAEARMYGKLEVPAWGANTVRSEFAFLSGLDAGQLGVHRFNPYRKLRRPVPTLASFLQGLGYRTVCIHPYPASFYRRDKVYPLLGFDEFIDIRSFDGAERCGPYISDLALAQKVETVLREAGSEPVFVFVITMENHGPLHLEKVQPQDVGRLYAAAPPTGCDDLTIYLRHLSNAGAMAAALRDTLKAVSRDAWLAWFGDHVPIMPGVYAQLGAPEGTTDYVIWHKDRGAGQAHCQRLRAEGLAAQLLHCMGLADHADARVEATSR